MQVRQTTFPAWKPETAGETPALPGALAGDWPQRPGRRRQTLAHRHGSLWRPRHPPARRHQPQVERAHPLRRFSDRGCVRSTNRRCLRTAASTRRPRSTFPTVSCFPRAATGLSAFARRRRDESDTVALPPAARRAAFWTAVASKARHHFGNRRLNHSNHVTPRESAVAAALCRRTPKRFAHFESHPPSSQRDVPTFIE